MVEIWEDVAIIVVSLIHIESQAKKVHYTVITPRLQDTNYTGQHLVGNGHQQSVLRAVPT